MLSHCNCDFEMENISISEKSEKAKAARGKSFTTLEDKNICIAWLAVSQDPIKGTDQQAHVFWTSVQQHAEMESRPWNSIRQRWGLISKLVAKFVGCFEAVSRVRVTGKSDEDIYNDAVTLFLEESKSKTWAFCECWEILRNSPKFKVIHTRTTPLKAKVAEKRSLLEVESDAESSSTPTTSSSFHDEPRPVGVKKAKLMVNQQKLEVRRATALEAIANASIKKNEILAEHTKALHAATELKLLTIPESTLDDVSLFIIQHRKEEILRKIQSSGTSTPVFIVEDPTEESCASRLIDPIEEAENAIAQRQGTVSSDSDSDS